MADNTLLEGSICCLIMHDFGIELQWEFQTSNNYCFNNE